MGARPLAVNRCATLWLGAAPALLVAATCGFLALGPSALAAPVLVDGVAASVGRQVITLSEVDLEARLLLVQRGGVLGIDAPIDDALRAKVLEYLIVQEALVRESNRRGGVLIAEREIDRVIAARRAKLLSADNYDRLLVSLRADEERLRTIVRRDLIVTALLDAALPKANVTDNEVTAFLLSNADFLPTAPAPFRRQKAKERIAAERKQAAFDTFTKALLKTVEVRRIATYALSAAKK